MKTTFKITFAASMLAVVLGGCNQPEPPPTKVKEDATDLPLRNADDTLRARFTVGDTTFDRVFLPADGLGPNYIRSSCSGCHGKAVKGPGVVQKMALVDADGFTPAADQSALQYGHTVRPYFEGGATVPLMPPTNSHLKLSLRVGIAVVGRGYMEAVSDDEILRVEAEQAARGDEIHGQVNRVVFHSQPNTDSRFPTHQLNDANLIGRFGLKARNVSLDDFAADASQGDMSITSPMRPTELANPSNAVDDFKTGIDADLAFINELADYMRLIEIPRRETPDDHAVALFATAKCAACHVPTLHTRADYPFAPLANIDAPIYTDLLIHDMGAALADGIVDESAGPRQWRTAPLIGLRHFRSFMHDGRAKSVAEAITAHGAADSEARGSAAAFSSLSPADQAALIAFVESL